MPTTGADNAAPAMEPWNGASPKANTPPSAAAPGGAGYWLAAATPTTGALSGVPPMDP